MIVRIPDSLWPGVAGNSGQNGPNPKLAPLQASVASLREVLDTPCLSSDCKNRPLPLQSISSFIPRSRSSLAPQIMEEKEILIPASLMPPKCR